VAGCQRAARRRVSGFLLRGCPDSGERRGAVSEDSYSVGVQIPPHANQINALAKKVGVQIGVSANSYFVDVQIPRFR